MVPPNELTLTNIKRKKRQENLFLKRLVTNKLAVVGLIIVFLFSLIALFAPLIVHIDPTKMNVNDALLGPGEGGHLLGTDNYGRDLFSRIVYGARVSLFVGVGSVVVGGAIGIVLGLISGFYGGIVDSIIMRIMDGMYAFPFILLAIVLMTVLGTGLENVILAIGLANVPTFSRIVRGQVLAVKQEEFIEVTRSLGARDFNLLFKHILPNCSGPIIVYGTMGIAGAIISEAALSFLGLGIQPPDPSWGNILQEGRDYLQVSPHICLFSGLAIFLSVLGFNLFGDGLRDALDPKTRV
ncbi:ABC transporter permease [Sporolactobacillus sp. THM19-2]|uniref:ABC transporter permease n=1 Tax=Sporolactobacillus sp. THM19-2 TaxID=2511171 RepID=UPI001022072D|nr:ABC transporter permease [Sporolactobacillus sp. THM19-2]RYL87046.1 ABC transporter permease [Sporolactobacillus sp. THM19-2]